MLLTDTHGDSIRELVPDDFREKQQEGYASMPKAHLHVDHVPVCLNCGEPNPTAYGGAKKLIRVDGVDLVADVCHECGQETVQVLEVHDTDDD